MSFRPLRHSNILVATATLRLRLLLPMQRTLNKQCWSCCSGGFTGYAQKKSQFRGCYKSRFNARSCASCQRFREQTDLPWCVICEKRLARCCSVCHTFSELDIQVCTFCSRSSAHTRYRGHDFCLSCVAGGWGNQSHKRRFESKYCNCCQACFQARTCEQCGTFNDEKHIAW